MASSQFSQFEDIPLHDVRSANDLVPNENYGHTLPPCDLTSSRMRKILNSSLLHIMIGILLAFALTVGAAIFGISMGKRHGALSTNVQAYVTVTPGFVTVVATTTVHEIVDTVTELRTTTIPFTGDGAISGKTVMTVTQTMDLPPWASGLPDPTH